MIDQLKIRGKAHLALMLERAKPVTCIPTAGVDAQGNLVINAEWFNTLNIRQVEAVLYHEALHIVLKHRARGRKWGGNPRAYNVAADAHINEHLPDLRPLGGVFFDTLPDIGVDPSTLTTEELATKLEECGEGLPEPHDDHGNEDGEGGDEGSEQQVSEETLNQARKAVESLPSKVKGCINKAFDCNVLTIGDQDDRMSSEESQIQRLIGSAWLSPRQESFARPNRRAHGTDLLLKGRASAFKKPIVDIYIDVSGSMAHMAPKWVAFGKSLCGKYGGQMRVSLWSNDVPAPSIVVPEDFKSGGTNWDDLEKRLNVERNSNHKTVVITDMEGCAPGQVDNADLVLKVKG